MGFHFDILLFFGAVLAVITASTGATYVVLRLVWRALNRPH